MDLSDINMASDQSFIKKLTHERLKYYLMPSDHNHEAFSNIVKIGLTSKPKFLLPQYLYDEKGSKLFELITEQPEYYVTNVEISILESSINEITDMYNEGILVELGSGNSRKTKVILNALLARRDSLHYFPIDISHKILEESSKALLKEYQNLSITGVVAEYNKGITLIKKDTPSRKLVVLLGSSLGNFNPAEAKKFVKMISDNIQDGDMFLIGLDMHKDSNILNAAYNDSRGITAQFNLNILERINFELNGNFNSEKFEHHAFYNESKRRVEMHLVSKVEQEVNIRGIKETIKFKKDESIHTENSYKFTSEQIENMIKESFQIVKIWTDKKKWYSVILMTPIK
ncbi:MAG: L-histidine N(alpha)-methyltransferase [Thaumarchaeota archaeon]|nr:L-histidine N(alpha)-methyltransferase [Nitrososphaerota archaeon]